LSARKVLIVDDNALNIELAAFVLEAAGFAVDVATDATQVRPRIDVSRPDLVLMDIQLPGVDGLEVTRQLKADPATRGIAVAAFTAFAMKGDEARMRAAGCDGYIAKPIDVATFAHQVSACLAAVGARPAGTNGAD
jgi:two-component system cell cycle response regulator DivK